jgi:hypothetical protein
MSPKRSILKHSKTAPRVLITTASSDEASDSEPESIEDIEGYKEAAAASESQDDSAEEEDEQYPIAFVVAELALDKGERGMQVRYSGLGPKQDGLVEPEDVKPVYTDPRLPRTQEQNQPRLHELDDVRLHRKMTADQSREPISPVSPET